MSYSKWVSGRRLLAVPWRNLQKVRLGSRTKGRGYYPDQNNRKQSLELDTENEKLEVFMKSGK